MLSTHLPNLRLTGATILRDGTMQNRTVAIAGGRISGGPYPVVDLTGYYILPGIIDMHGDAFERHIAPRPSAPFPLAMGLRGVDRDAAANGVTTAWLAQSWSWEGGQRGPEFAEKVMAALTTYRPQSLTDLRLQIRYETHELDSAERLLDAVKRHRIDYVVFNNHLEEAVELWDSRPHEVTLWAKRGGRSGEDLMKIVHAALTRSREVPRSLCRLAEAFDALGVLYGSHDDPDGETRELFSALGARICEFPTAFPAASVARALGEPVLMGAPNVVRGGSQAGNIPAISLIKAGKCDALVSDYHYPALAQAAFALVDQGVMDMPRAWAMISTVPARIMRLTDRGEIAPGKRADLTIIHRDSRAIEGTIVGGRITYLAGDAAHRFLGADRPMEMAAE
jgi:alpha-D-ribose 1-methylphosphonate 5-triphosphate diphosphatase